tara:strand:- start:108 stop:1271 length:1164 start_codon:yes stop_codon:yes gene_type:complete
MNILIEGWRGINHSYALVNQWQITELIKSSNIAFKDVPFLKENWNTKKNNSGLDEKNQNIINNIEPPTNNLKYDITYRISGPFNFDNNFQSKLLFVFATCEFKYLKNESYTNGSPELLRGDKKFFIHTPSNWSKKGFLDAGFKDDQIIVIPHGVDTLNFDIVEDEEEKSLKEKLNINAENFVLTNIGAMTQNKGIDLLVAAYGLLKKKFKHLKLILKDQSNLYDIKPNYVFNMLSESELNKKYKIINDAMLKDVIIISKNLNFNQIKKIYSITDCYISPYRGEGFNLTPLEAAACGTQIIVTKGGSTDDYFDECLGFQIESNEKKIDNSYLLEPKLGSLLEILENKIINKKDEFKKQRRDYVHNNFSWQKIVKDLKKEFEKKLNKNI